MPTKYDLFTISLTSCEIRKNAALCFFWSELGDAKTGTNMQQHREETDPSRPREIPNLVKWQSRNGQERWRLPLRSDYAPSVPSCVNKHPPRARQQAQDPHTYHVDYSLLAPFQACCVIRRELNGTHYGVSGLSPDRRQPLRNYAEVICSSSSSPSIRLRLRLGFAQVTGLGRGKAALPLKFRALTSAHHAAAGQSYLWSGKRASTSAARALKRPGGGARTRGRAPGRLPAPPRGGSPAPPRARPAPPRARPAPPRARPAPPRARPAPPRARPAHPPSARARSPALLALLAPSRRGRARCACRAGKRREPAARGTFTAGPAPGPEWAPSPPPLPLLRPPRSRGPGRRRLRPAGEPPARRPPQLRPGSEPGGESSRAAGASGEPAGWRSARPWSCDPGETARRAGEAGRGVPRPPAQPGSPRRRLGLRC
ncbi:serine/arginine-rich splicing factor SR45-like [Onychomys torridus]|uniref:serine/arginine-rich splicing factor SR45-like n=1 Tax=Onychomys torridus TaxID=38674 RepID=UPI00167F5A23|nr:serine/arginine-rich splicing factor SR45-like [Onychomys torridus]